MQASLLETDGGSLGLHSLAGRGRFVESSGHLRTHRLNSSELSISALSHQTAASPSAKIQQLFELGLC